MAYEPGAEFHVWVIGRLARRILHIVGPGIDEGGVYIRDQMTDLQKAEIVQNLLNQAYEKGKQDGGAKSEIR